MKIIMKKSNPTPTPAKSVEEWMNQVRSSYSHMLKEHLRIYKKYDRLKTIQRDEKVEKYFDFDVISYYDENGKINWEVIRQFIPPNMKKRIKEEFNMLNDNEVRLCCLLFFKVSKKTISNILPLKFNSIKPAVFRIRRKTGVENMQEIFKIFLGNFS